MRQRPCRILSAVLLLVSAGIVTEATAAPDAGIRPGDIDRIVERKDMKSELARIIGIASPSRKEA